MRYTTNYIKLPDDKKMMAAVKDIKEYLGMKKFYQMTEDFKAAGKIDSGQFEFICAVGGIEGYPVEAWYKFCYENKSPWSTKS